MEAILRSFLKSHLSSYISSSEDDGAGLSFKGVELRAEEYPRVERFSARSLEILVPWAALARQSIEVHFRGVDLALGRLSTTGDETGQRGTETRQEMDGDDLIASTRGRPWDEGELSGSEWREGEPGAAESGEVGGASWVGMSIRSRLIRSGLNVSLFVEDLTFTEDLGANKAIVHVASLSVVNIPAEDWEELVRNPDGWLGKAVIMEDVHVSIGESRMHVGSLHLSSVLPLYEFLAEDFDYTGEGDRHVADFFVPQTWVLNDYTRLMTRHPCFSIAAQGCARLGERVHHRTRRSPAGDAGGMAIEQNGGGREGKPLVSGRRRDCGGTHLPRARAHTGGRVVAGWRDSAQGRTTWRQLWNRLGRMFSRQRRRADRRRCGADGRDHAGRKGGVDPGEWDRGGLERRRAGGGEERLVHGSGR